MQQQMIDPRSQMTTRPMAPGYPTQNQQYNDVSNYELMGYLPYYYPM